MKSNHYSLAHQAGDIYILGFLSKFLNVVQEIGKGVTTEFDVVIIGGGPNGLIAGAYLAKAGLKVAVVEKRHEAGGGLAAEEITIPGFIHNTHAIYMLMVDYAPPFIDFAKELEEAGVRFIYPSIQWAIPTRNDKCMIISSDPKLTIKSIRRISERDAETYEKLYNKCKRFVDEIIAPATYVHPSPPIETIEKLSKVEVGKEFLEISEQSMWSIINEQFEDSIVKTLVLYLTCLWGIKHDESGLGFLFPLYFYVHTRMRLVAGTSHRLASALMKIILRNNGVILDNFWVDKIIVEDGVAKGVRSVEGETITSRITLSTLNPHQTFIELVGEDNLTETFAREIKRWKWEEMSLSILHLALNNPPSYKASTYDKNINEALCVIIGYESPEELISYWNSVTTRRLPDKLGGHATCPTLFDPSQSYGNPGKHTAYWQSWAPYDLNGNARNWDIVKEKYVSIILETWSKYSPNMTKENILGKHLDTPLDIERRLITMTQGSIKHGLYTALQLGYFRPHPTCSSCRTPIRNLYVGGASVYPGGCVTFGPGYNAANAIADDLKIRKWWTLPGYVVRAKERGII